MGAVLLVQPPLGVNRDFVDYPYHCDMGVVQAAAVLRDGGFEVALVDAFALEKSGLHEGRGSRILLGADPEETIEAIRRVLRQRVSVDLVVIAYSPFNRPPCRDPILAELLAGLREQSDSVPILLADLYQSGQHYIAADDGEILTAYPEVDALLRHEAEGVLVQVAGEMVSQGRQMKPWSRSGEESADLGLLPVPAWDLVDLDARDAFMRRVDRGLGRPFAFPIDGRTLPAITSRGCPYGCQHCSSNPGRGEGPKTQRRLDARGRDRLIDALATRFGATRVHFLDEMVNVHPGHLDGLLEALSATDMAYDFPNGMRADHLGESHLSAMAGRITTLSISAESGAQRVVDEVVGKRLKLSSIERTLSLAKELGIATMVHFIVGMPQERAEEINRTLGLALDLHRRFGAEPALQFATPLPGTPLAEVAGVPAPPDHDWAPLFQHQPVTSGMDFTSEDLRWFKWTFERRLAAAGGKRKLILNLTYRCNNRCVFCAVGNRSQRDGSFEKQKRVVEEFAGKGVDSLDIDGGEPTLHPKMLALIRHAIRQGYRRINVTTNGRMCSYESFARRLVRSGISTMLFSLHGANAKEHEASVRVPEAFEQTVAGIQNCVTHKPREVELGVNVTVTRANQGSLPMLAALVNELGLAWMNLQFLTPFGRATIEVAPDMDVATHSAARVIEEWKGRMKIQVVNLPFCFMPGNEEYLAGDLLKLRRDMVFVDNTEVNLHDYLLAKRGYEPGCEGCRHRVFCGGFYRLDEAPEAPMIIGPEDIE